MDAKELRLGNYVMYYGGSDTPSHREVDLDILNSITRGHSHDFGEINLTEEWLLKYGFKKDVTYTLGSVKIWHSYYTGSFLFRYGHDSTRTIKYVHQLQNLYFSLTGEDLIYA